METTDNEEIRGDKGVRLKDIRIALGLTQNGLAERIGVRQQNIANMESGKRPIGLSITYRLTKELNINPEWWESGDGEMFLSDVNTVTEVPKPKEEWGKQLPRGRRKPPGDQYNAEPLPPIDEFEDGGSSKSGNHFLEHHDGTIVMSVPLVETYAQAGYPAGWNDPEYLEALPRHSITVDKHHRGVYRAFRVRGDSMDNGSSKSLLPGDIVTGRRIERHHWKSKLHLHKYRVYIIVQEDGIIVKNVLQHDVERGIIFCGSLNPDKEMYPDFDIELDSLIELYNVVGVDRKFEL